MQLTLAIAVAVLAAVCVSSGLAVNPGLRMAITSKGLAYINQVTIPLLEEELSSMKIPDISGQTKVLGLDVDYSVTNIAVNDLSIPTSSLTPGSAGLTLQASDISADLSADWHYKEHSLIPISDSGTLDIAISSVSLSVSVIVGTDTSGHFILSTTGCSFNVGDLEVHFHGGASWLYNLFDDDISDKIKDELNDQTCTQVTSYINTVGSQALESLPMVIQLDEVSEINYELIRAPNFTSTYITSEHKGEFYSLARPVEAPFTPPPLPPVSNTSRMMYVWLTDYIANTAGFVYQRAGVLQYNITPDMIPPEFAFQLNTSSFKTLIPQLYKKYPNMSMSLVLAAAEPPTLRITPRGANFTLPSHVNFYVLDSHNTTHLAFILGVVAYIDLHPWVQWNGTNEIIKANATYLSLVHTNIGNFSVGLLQRMTDVICRAFIVPLLNRYGNIGLPIPIIDGIVPVNATITMGQDYVVMSTNFTYKPPPVHMLKP